MVTNMSLGIQKLTKNLPFTRKILVFGPAGDGKTTFAASIREAGFNPLIVDMDGGSKTLEGTDHDATVQRKLNDLEKVVWLFKSKNEEVKKYDALIVDGISEAARRELQEITTLAAKASEGSKKERDRDQAQIAEYGLRNNRLLRLIRELRDLTSIPVIITAWSKTIYPQTPDGKENKEAAPAEIIPDFSESLKEVIPGLMDDVWLLRENKTKKQRELYTANYEAVKAKTRNKDFAALLTTKVGDTVYPVLVNPTMTDIVNAYKQAMTGNNSNSNSKEESK